MQAPKLYMIWYAPCRWYCAPRRGAFFYTEYYAESTAVHAQSKPEKVWKNLVPCPFKARVTHQKGSKHEFHAAKLIHFSTFTTRNTAQFLLQQNAALLHCAYGFIQTARHLQTTHQHLQSYKVLTSTCSKTSYSPAPAVIQAIHQHLQ